MCNLIFCAAHWNGSGQEFPVDVLQSDFFSNTGTEKHARVWAFRQALWKSSQEWNSLLFAAFDLGNVFYSDFKMHQTCSSVAVTCLIICFKCDQRFVEIKF